MTPFEVFCAFLCVKQHFTKPSYDIFKYNWKTRASIKSYNVRKDRYFFEKLSRQKNEQEIKDFFVSNFAYSQNARGVYIPDLIREGEETYLKWKRNIQSLSYLFKTELEVFISHRNLNEFMKCEPGQHSPLLRKYISSAISLETLVIIDKLLNFVSSYDKILTDPIWEIVSLKVKKYSPFLSINRDIYLEIMREIVCE